MDAADTPARRPPGAVLAAERERLGLSRTDIAQRLHMSVLQVEALEAGDYARLPRGMFLRGFVRNYARTLGLDAEAIVNALGEGAPREAPPKIVVASQNIRFDPLGERFSSPYVKAASLAIVAVLLGFAGMYWWVFIRPAAPAISAKAPHADARRAAPATAPAAAPAPAPEPVAVRAPEPVPAAPVAAAAPAASREPASPAVEPAVAFAAPKPVPAEPPMDPAPVIAAGGSVIRFKFKGTSWVEIKDGRGKLLLSRNNPGGSEAEVMGRPPFVVVVGNAPEVRMFYNNREFDLEPHTRVAVARFTVE
jgi:cytoskeleton protein RodZ